jgi:hypothetical protein
MDIIITDLTRFENKQIVCTAGINPETNECIRPMPYLPTSECKRLNILPGAVLRGNFGPAYGEEPHSEDRKYVGQLTFRGPCSAKRFRSILKETATTSVEEGFSVALDYKQKHIPTDNAPKISIITLSIDPPQIDIVSDAYNSGRIKVIFTDGSGKTFSYLPITDLGFYNYAMMQDESCRTVNLNNYLHSQDEVFIRLGLSRTYQAPNGRSGFWLQVNGIYTFLEYLKEIRCHK